MTEGRRGHGEDYLGLKLMREGEDPRALRALLAQAPFETMSAVASHYRFLVEMGRPPAPSNPA